MYASHIQVQSFSWLEFGITSVEEPEMNCTGQTEQISVNLSISHHHTSNITQTTTVRSFYYVYKVFINTVSFISLYPKKPAPLHIMSLKTGGKLLDIPKIAENTFPLC